jgi:multidrug resistance protein MdtO
VAMGSPRISYAGMQIALAFLLSVMQGAGPQFDLTIARDRVIGVLLGNVMVYLVFTRVWPVSIAKRVDATVAALLQQWRAIVQTADPQVRRSLAAEALVQGASVRQDFGLMHYEPTWVRPAADWVASRRRVLTDLGDLELPLFLAGGRAGSQATPNAALVDGIETQLGRITDTVRTYEAMENTTDARS